MFPFAVEAGIDAREFWLYTPAEINATLEGYKKRLTTQATLDYAHADTIVRGVAALMDKKNKMPKPHEVYPGLIQEPSRSSQIHPEIAKQRLMKFANAHNAKRKQVKNE